MTLKEELEILRGEPIQVYSGDPMDIPCIETSDPERLCKHPVVSVNMITYNHEPYIRQAIEGVMMQKTDFEFELVIGEDCSTDKTREICFEYQKKYPDKIRVLWSHENITVQHPHPAGRNSTRVMVRCRGEFMAFCEGDDYWIDPLKLQKQVDVMRAHPEVGFCFCGSKIFEQETGITTAWNDGHAGFQPGFITSRKYVLWTMFGKQPARGWGSEFWQMTATFMVRKSVYVKATKSYDIFSWKLSVGDSVICLGCGSLGDAYYIADDVSVYRRASSGVTVASRGKCGIDTLLVRLYFARKYLGLQFDDVPDVFVKVLVVNLCSYFERLKHPDAAETILAQWMLHKPLARLLKRNIFNIHRFLNFRQSKIKKYARWISYYNRFITGCSISPVLFQMYKSSSSDGADVNIRYRVNLVGSLLRKLGMRK